MSQLMGILSRLKNLQDQADTLDTPQRFFEVDGEKKCSVKYLDRSATFELEVYEDGAKPQSFQFDNIDIIAIEIYDLIH